jgi:protein subunit release factor B
VASKFLFHVLQLHGPHLALCVCVDKDFVSGLCHCHWETSLSGPNCGITTTNKAWREYMKRRDSFKRGYHRKICRIVPLLLGFTSLTRNTAAWSPRMATTVGRRVAMATTVPCEQLWRQCAVGTASSSSHCPGRRSVCDTPFSPLQRRAAMSTALFVAPPCALASQRQRLRYRTIHGTTTFAFNNAFSWFYSSAISRNNRRSRHDYSKLNYSTKENEAADDKDNDWVVPDTIHIPTDQLDISFVRSSGAGGQNVNKVSSCVQVRFHVLSASWMPLEVRERFGTLYSATINKDGVYWTECQEHRTQVANRHAVLQKLHRAVRAAWPRPKQRHLREGISNQGKRQRKQDKQFQKLKKEGRRRVDF